MSKEETTVSSEKRTQKKGLAPSTDSTLAAGSELHQVADGFPSPLLRYLLFYLLKSKSCVIVPAGLRRHASCECLIS